MEHFHASLGVSIRRACWLVSIHRKTYFYKRRPDPNVDLRQRLKELAERHPKYGSPMLYFMLRREMVVNHKRVDRIYREEGLSLRRKTRRKRTPHLREALPVPERPDDVWSMDFVHDALSSGRGFKCLTMVDHCSRECPEIRVDHSIRGHDVVESLEVLRLSGRKPNALILDNGPEFRSKALALWAVLHDVKIHFIDPGCPTQNAFIESLNGKFRNECLNSHWYRTIDEARLYATIWRKEHFAIRPHRSLGGKTPKEVADQYRIGVTTNVACL